MIAQLRARLREGRSGEQTRLPVAGEPVEDQRLVDDRRLVAEHQIDLQRLIDEDGIGDAFLDLLFERENEPGPHQALERLLIEPLGGVANARPFVEAKGRRERRGR